MMKHAVWMLNIKFKENVIVMADFFKKKMGFSLKLIYHYKLQG